MIITIDTKKDTAEDIKKLISFLQQILNENTDIRKTDILTNEQTSSLFGMLGENSGTVSTEEKKDRYSENKEKDNDFLFDLQTY